MSRQLILLSFFILATLSLRAQRPDEAVTTDEDSVIVDVPASAHNEEEPADNDPAIFYYPPRRTQADSVAAWRNERGFGYTRYLDSMLRLKNIEQQQSHIRQMQKQHNGNNKKGGQNGEDDEIVIQQDQNWMGSFFQSPALRVILWILAAGFVLFILYRLFFAQGLFIRKTTSLKKTDTDDNGDEELPATGDFDRLARQAAASGNYRLAVRYHYLQVLHKLAGKNLLELSVDKTNYQYVRELSGTAFRDEFAALTLHYEYVWYGEFNIQEPVYNRIAGAFTHFDQKL